ncbi:MAG: apolipoprotein N-acyltransferase [Proteobacteria bacterium]|nr:apolipoprotein N-acyltransferase [Pseudomonadota bacterium]MDA1355681.1 apolipoprotein N-acyltransferase [Pseudomonadota bacterium]
MNSRRTVGVFWHGGNGFILTLANHVAALDGWRRSLLGFCLGVAAAGALPPAHVLPLLVPAFAGLLWLIAAARSPWRAALSGWWFGFGHFLAACYWVGAALLTDPDKFAWVAAPAVLGLSAGLALFPALAALAVFLSRRTGFSRLLVFAVFWTVAEWLRGHLLSGFPMNLIGTSWTISEGMIQMVAVAGVYGLSFITILAAAAPALLAEHREESDAVRNWRVPAAMILLLAAIWVGGTVRLAVQHPAALEGVKLLIVQANIPQQLKWRADARQASMEKHRRMTLAVPPGSFSHVIWPETAVPYDVSNDPRLAAWLAAAVPEDGLLFTGALRRGGEPGEAPILWNSLHAIDAKGGLSASYDKHHLVPFGEYMPLRSIMSFAKLTHGNLDFSAGLGAQTLTVPGLPSFSPLICYEAIFPGQVTARDSRPGWLLNITNDGWFGNTAGPYQHLQAARLRAVEEGLPLVRAANTGISAVIDPLGRYVGRLALGTEGVLLAALPRALGRTPYAMMGDLTMILVLIISLGIVFLRAFRETR